MWSFCEKRMGFLKSHPEGVIVVFVDVGYAHSSAHAVLCNDNKSSLVCSKVAKNLGSRNLDDKLMEFYADLFMEQTKTKDLLKNPKSVAKMREEIQKQREILSANKEHEIHIYYLGGEEDFTYNMRREQFEDLNIDFFGEISTMLSDLKSEVCMHGSICNVELFGNTSMTPFIKEIASDIFGIGPSNFLNSSEALAQGGAIAGTFQLGWVERKLYEVELTLGESIAAVWVLKGKKRRRGVFRKGGKYPSKGQLALPEGGAGGRWAERRGGGGCVCGV